MQSGVGATDDLGPLRLIVSAIAGQAMEVTTADAGSSSWCDGTTVFLEPGFGTVDQVQVLAVQGSLVAAGSFEPGILQQLARRPKLAQRFLAVEGHRALWANESVLPPCVLPLIDRDVAQSVMTAAASLTRAHGQGDITPAPRVFGVIDAKRCLAAVRRHPDEPIGRSADGRTRQAGGDLMGLDDEESVDGDLGDLMTSPVGGGGVLGRLLQKLLSPARRRGGGGPPGAEAPTNTAERGLRRGREGFPSSSLGERDAVHDVPAEAVKQTYPEWDDGNGRYRQDWCTVVESDAPADTVSTLQWPNGRALRRSLARLGTGMSRCRRQPQGDDLDLDAAVEAYIDTAVGAVHGDDVYLDSRRRRRDLGVLVLLDVSGSAGEPGTAGRSVHEHQRTAAFALTTALHDLGDRVALYAFNSRGRQAVQVVRVKGFDDGVDVQMARRLTGLEPAAYTRLGAAVRHGAAILEGRSGTPRHLLVVLSDGLAYDHGYGDRYGEADARRSLTEARRRGIGCLCLSVGTSADPITLSRVFGSAAHATIPRPEDLSEVIAPLIHAAVRSAEGQQRVYVRHQRTRERRQVEMEMR